MNAKEYLNSVSKLDKLISNKLLEIEHWHDVATSTGTFSSGDRVQSSGSKQKMADAICEYIDIQRELRTQVAELIRRRQEVITTIEQLPIDEYDVLHKRYIQGLELWEVADAKQKSYSWANSVHGRALAHVQRILNERKGQTK